VEYGQDWVERFTGILSLSKFLALSMGGLFCLVTVFIISNTIRLALYSRREEIEIMRLVGATDTFIKIPSYLAGIIQGAAGGLVGLTALYISYRWLIAKLGPGFSAYEIHIRFLPRNWILWILLYSICVGWVGCLVSLRQFLKKI
jgi:cell division transport system permease protein